jgi:hypothetical protein
MWNEGIEEEEKLRDGISRISANFDECLEFLKAQD